VSEPQRWSNINAAEQTIQVTPSSLCCRATVASNSPIDDFYEYIASVLPLGSPDALKENSALGRVLLLGLVSGTELYFRSIISGLIRVCPLARKHASSHQLTLGAVDYYGMDDLGLGLLESVSMATSGELRSKTEKLTRLKWNQGTSLDSAVVEFEKLCQFRHAAIHSRGELGDRNVRELQVETIGSRLALSIDFSSLQTAAAICQNVVRAYNRFMYKATVQRWIDNKTFGTSWKANKNLFTPLFQLFYSQRDGLKPENAYLAYRSIAPTIRASLILGP